MKFNGWPRTMIRLLFNITSSFVHHFKPFGEFTLELLSGNAQFGSKSVIVFLSPVTLKFDGWPWKTIGHLFYATSSFVHHFKAINELKLELQSGNERSIQVKISDFFVPCYLEIWWMTLKSNRAPLPIVNTSSFVHHFVAIGEFKLKLESGNAQFGSKSANHCPVWPWNLTDDLEKQ